MSLICLFLSFHVFFFLFWSVSKLLPFFPCLHGLVILSLFPRQILLWWLRRKHTGRCKRDKQICFLSAGDVSKCGIWTGRPTRNVEKVFAGDWNMKTICDCKALFTATYTLSGIHSHTELSQRMKWCGVTQKPLCTDFFCPLMRYQEEKKTTITIKPSGEITWKY